MDGDPLLHGNIPSVGFVDYRGYPVSRLASGGWTAALFMIGVEIAERFSYVAIAANLISFLTGPLGESTAAAAAAVNVWSGVSMLLPLLGAFVADSYLGRYWTIVVASLLYVLGLGMLTLFSMLPTRCRESMDLTTCRPSHFELAFFYFSLYLVAFAHGGHKPCVQAFGADQFDQNDPKECESRSSFFNWWYLAMCGGIVATLLIMSYVQENIGWGLGFGIPCIVMGLALIILLLGTKTYRYYLLEDKSSFCRIVRGFITIARSQQASQNIHPTTSETEAGETCLHPAPVQSNISYGSHCSYPINEDGDGHRHRHSVEDAKRVLRLFPIWVSCLMYGVVFAQLLTFFNKQGSTMDRRIGPTLQVPSVALQSLISASALAFLPIYDRVLVPIARKFSRKPSGITMLQRIGTGMVLSAICIMIAALVEMKRLKTARDFGLLDSPTVAIPMSLWWLVPQFVLHGISEAFAMVGFQEFFYDQVPDALRSLGLALYLSILGIGSFISSFLVSVIDDVTGKTGESWFSNNLNRAHLDYFYWLLVGLSVVDLVIYLYFAQSYVYKEKGL